MQPPQRPGPYDGPAFPMGPQGPPPYGPPPGAYPSPAPPRRSRPGPFIVIGALVLVLAVVAGGLWYASRSKHDGGFAKTPAACWLVGQAQVQAYLPGATSDGDDPYFCTWVKPAGTKDDQTGRLYVGVETLGDPPTVKEAVEQYDIRRRQADDPGVVITPVSAGDESFMACASPSQGRPGSCKIYTRVRNVVFDLEFESFAVPGARDPATAVRALDAQAVQHLQQSG